MLSACIGWRGGAVSLIGHVFGASRAVTNNHPSDNYRRFASFLNGQRASLCVFVQLLL